MLNIFRLTQTLALFSVLLGTTQEINAQEAPSKQYGQGKDVPLAWILDEWHRKHPQIPLYLCVCTKAECDNSQSWPFRRYGLGGVLPALGDSNKTGAQQLGFSCGEVEASQLQGIGG